MKCHLDEHSLERSLGLLDLSHFIRDDRVFVYTICMTHRDHVQLIEKGIRPSTSLRKKQVWADFGSGEGAFTLALRDVTGPEVEIYSLDLNPVSLKEQKRQFDIVFPNTNIHFLTADFTRSLDVPLLDGILAANSIHFVENKLSVFTAIRKRLKKSGKLIVVEYNVDSGNTWVPYPFSYDTFQQIMMQTGFRNTQLLATIPSKFLNEIYAASAEV